MARTLLALKLAIQRNQWQAPRLRAAAVLALVVAALGAVGGLLLLAALSRSASAGAAVLVLGSAMVAIGWIGMPVLLFTIDDTLDPARLAPYPLTVGQLLSGQLLTGLVGVGPIAVAVAGIGALAYASDLGGVLLVAAAVGLLVLLGVSGSRALTNLLSSRLRSRRGGDLAIVVGTVLLGLSAAALQLAAPALRDPPSFVGSTTYEILSWTPGGALGRAVTDVADGQSNRAALRLVYVALVVAALVAVWWYALERLLRDQGGPGGATAGRSRSLFRGGLAVLPRDRFGAVVAREVIERWGDPRRKSNLIASALIPIVLLALGTGLAGAREIEVFASFAPALLMVTETANGLGHAGPAIWMDVTTPGSLRRDVLALGVAGVAVSLPVMAVTALVLAAIGGGWQYLPAALVTSTAVSFLAHGTSALAAVLAPSPVAKGRNVFTAAGSAVLAVVPAILTMATTVVLALPVFGVTWALAYYFLSALWAMAGAVAGLVYAGLVWWGLTRWAWRVYAQDPLRVLEAIDLRSLA